MGTLMIIGVSTAFLLTSAISVNAKDDASPMLDTIFCPFRPDPWACTRQNVARMLTNWDAVLDAKLQEFKAEADAEYEAKVQSRDFTARADGEKPSVVMTSMENTIANIAESVSERLDQFLRRPKTGDLEVDGQMQRLGEETSGEVNALEATVNEAEGGTGEEIESARYAGETRGKKKKKKKALMKLLLLGAIVKGKIELLLKLLSAHLQLKFLAIAAIGLLVNVARFWIDLKKGHHPQKVIYYEHAQHQHHYDDHGDDWNGGGGYWKRSIPEASESEIHELPYRYQKPTAAVYQPQAPPYLY
ncbi:uncharacterized protein LOC132264295 isoform X1 [Phlebotomus argentipes]|uniref:uncharacterized protein LOC132264295 isoform X1 n=1 Tax=Phlebotomus argentipes TaxID=94469 RepID=UPI002893498F|nr:uncharacterized protein LOC132264295 isoform X1 [Phlebotomus argentipes]XP_059620406.1 uncharacterized protein LOC132264295 isoform X1 [Phlebotomus argentipes]